MIEIDKINELKNTFATSTKKVSNFGHWDKIGNVRLASGGRAPVDFDWALGEDLKRKYDVIN